MTDNEKTDDNEKITAEDLERQWGGSGIAFAGVFLGAFIVITTVIIIAAISYGLITGNAQIIEAVFNLIER